MKPDATKDKRIRDPIHAFIKITPDEQRIVDHRCFQRLRDISQLAFVSFVYPGATNKRFEHSLGVMDLSTNILDETVSDDEAPEEKAYWRQVLRIAALCHDIGHLPFSHTLEGLLKEETGGKNHEDLSRGIIEGELRDIKDDAKEHGEGSKEAPKINLKGYHRIYDELREGDFSFCYIYAASDIKEDVKEIIAKYNK